MTIDLTKIKAGDKVRLGGEFEVDRAEIDAVRIVATSGGNIWMYADMIAEHIPAPKQFAVGQKVVTSSASLHVLIVLHQDGNDVMVRHSETGGADVYFAAQLQPY